MRCKGCGEQFNVHKLKGRYCKNCIESLNLKVCKKCQQAFPPTSINDGYCYSCSPSQKKKGKKKRIINKMLLLVIILGATGGVAYIFAYLSK